MQAPTEKQIRLVENMTQVLGIDFPQSSTEFTKFNYSKWISCHMDDFCDALANTIVDEDYCYEVCLNDVWCEWY